MSAATTPYRRLGHSTLDVSAVGLGCMGLSGVYGPADDAESITLVHRAIDLGVNHVDSSDMYGWGHNEELLGRALKGRRERVILATKFGQVQNPGGPNKVDGRAEYVIQACETSLKRLGVDVIDLYYQHRVDPKVPIEDTVGGMKRLVEQGKVRYLGLWRRRPRRCAARTACIPSAPCRASTRCCIASRPRQRCRPCASSESRSSPTRRSAAAC